MSHASHKTQDHKKIKKWVEERGGQPATIEDTAAKGEEAGLLRIDFPGGASSPPLTPISWEVFFDKFDEEKLTFLYQDELQDGNQSTFCKFVRA